MRIIGARWTPTINMLCIKCDCGIILSHRADRWKVQCRRCRREESLHFLRDRYVEEENADRRNR